MVINPADFRVDAADKIAGRTRYIRDETIPGLWYGATVRCPHPRARILNVQFNPEFDWDRVVVATAKDFPVNVVAMLERDMPFLADEIANYAGESVVILAAPDRKTLAQACSHVKVDYEPLPALLDPLQSEGSEIRIFKDNNLFKDILIKRGNLEEAQRLADEVIEIECQTGLQEHLYLEPQGIVAIPDGDRIIIRGSMQCPYYIKGALEEAFAGKKQITVIQSPTGGAFGGKEDFPSIIAGHAALLAVKCGHPVAFFFDREEDVQFTTKRHPSYHRSKAYVRRDGKLLGLDLNIILDGGAYATLSQVVVSRCALTACGCYYIPHVRVRAQAVATNTLPPGAFRGFGGPQAVFGIEMLMEKIALTMNLPSDEVRRMNLIEVGQTTSTGQVLKYSVSAQECFEDVLLRADYQRKVQQYREQNRPILERLQCGEFPLATPDDKLKGIGVCSFLHGAGFTGTGENRIQGKVRVGLTSAGKVMIYTAQTEMGQGQQTAFRKILADALKLSIDQVLLAEVNTDIVPDSGPTVASRSTMIIGSLLVDAAAEIISLLSVELSEVAGVQFEYRSGYFYGGDQIIPLVQAAQKHADLVIEKRYHHPPLIQFDDVNYRGDAYPAFSWAAAVAEIEVDPLTFETRVVRYATTQEIGKAINYDQAVAQIQGGSLQGIGHALYEKVELKGGKYDVTGFTDYIIPTLADTPEFDVKILENPYPFGPFGAKGLGELPFVGAAPAVLSAFWMIFGKEFNRIPLLPEEIQERLKTED